jgi:hypothetical protein
VVGSTIATQFQMRSGKPVLVRLPKIDFIDDKTGKPIGINKFIGRRPIFAFGNSDGDQQMLEWTAAGSGTRFMALVLHTDREREWANPPQVSRRAPRHGARRGAGERLDRGRHEAPACSRRAASSWSRPGPDEALVPAAARDDRGHRICLCTNSLINSSARFEAGEPALRMMNP